jgi:hypothetical protein
VAENVYFAPYLKEEKLRIQFLEIDFSGLEGRLPFLTAQTTLGSSLRWNDDI